MSPGTWLLVTSLDAKLCGKVESLENQQFLEGNTSGEILGPSGKEGFTLEVRLLILARNTAGVQFP
jgi:hypothetical protein